MYDELDFVPTTYENCGRVNGPFYHGTAAALPEGELLVPGFGSNYQKGRISNHIYFSTTVPGLAAELDTELLEAKASLQGGKSQSSQRMRLYALKADGGFLAVWDELSRA
ncbi:MAG: NAD(+)--rifampin ADP-ribosyltransferase, partial [Deltaproteobacteria bacterium]|nr:NAD(+)--rifampin ADP-ribosyltransferase [Deltaproteobacteria bacterium]